MIAGNTEEDTEQVKTRRFKWQHWLYSILVIAIGTVGFAFISQYMTEIVNFLGSLVKSINHAWGWHAKKPCGDPTLH